MKIQFIGAAHEVTGSCHYLQVGTKHILIDCGMEQGGNTFENAELPVDAARIDVVLLTHAHVDHSGYLPWIYAKGFRGNVYMTKATADLCSIMLRDCAHIQMQEAEWQNRKAKRSAHIPQFEPLYTMEHADGVIRRIVPCQYDRVIDICDGVRARFTDIGHLLGSASIEVWAEEGNNKKKIVFSGDIGNKNQPIINDPKKTEEADYVVMESTYGNRVHSETRPDYIKELVSVLKRTFDRGGNVVIPSFAVGRTQEMLYFLRKIKTEGLVEGHPNFPVYVDSPLAVEATGVFRKNEHACFDEEAKALVESGINPLTFSDLYLTITSDESKEINMDDEPKVIISASGMCEAGRIRHHLKHNLWTEKSTILFVGYQAGGTLGRIILDGASEVKLFGEIIQIRAEILQLPGISGHADKDGLLDWIKGFRNAPEKVFVVHGEDTVCTMFAEELSNTWKIPAEAPYSGSEFDLIENRWIVQKQPILIHKKAKQMPDAFARLLAAGERLLAVIRHNEGIANKDIAKFTSQVNSLADKWEHFK